MVEENTMRQLATDPPVSEKQRRAMWAAREGNSTLGIPKEVGEEFTKGEKPVKDRAAAWDKLHDAIVGLRGSATDDGHLDDQAWDGLLRALDEFMAYARGARDALPASGGVPTQVSVSKKISRPVPGDATAAQPITRETGGNPTQGISSGNSVISVQGAATERKPTTRDAFDVGVFHGTRRTALESILDNGLQAHPSRHYHPDRFYKGERGNSVYVAIDPVEAARWALSEVASAGDATVLEIEVPEESLVPDEEWSGAERHVGDIPPTAIMKVYPVNEDGTLGEETCINRRPINEGRVRWVGVSHGDPPDENAPDWPATKADGRLVYPPDNDAAEDDLSGRFELLPGALQMMDKKTGQVFLIDDVIRKLTAKDAAPAFDKVRDRTKTPAQDAAALAAYLNGTLDPEVAPRDVSHDEAMGYVQRRLATRELPAMDKALWHGMVALREHDAPAGLCFDRMSVRRYSEDGHLHVARSRIAQARIDGYLGKEIPGWQQLDLDPERIYQLFRDPRELSRPETVESFVGKPILETHEPISADQHNREIVVGSIGSDVTWNPPFLEASLHFWPMEAIDAIESGEKKQLSPSYHYEVDDQPGVWNGQKYDLRMKNIRANHLALVQEGRQGPSVVVADEALSDPRWVAIERAIRALG
jgi:hypothetical protein